MKFDIFYIDSIFCGSFWQEAKFNNFLEFKKFITPVNIDFMPMIQKRRLSNCAKMLFHAFNNCPKKSTPIIFSSNEGESNRCCELLEMLARDGFVSPNSFSLSVHNSVAALLSIFYHNNNQIYAISSSASLEYGLLNAHLMLQNGCNEVVLMVYNENINQTYYKENDGSCALVLGVKKGSSISLDYCENTANLENKYYHTDEISIIQFLENVGKNSSWQTFDNSRIWNWKYEV